MAKLEETSIKQQSFWGDNPQVIAPAPAAQVHRNGTANRLESQDRAFHDWYRFVLAFPPHLVRQYFEKFGLSENSVVLDPFCGTGTTLIEAKLSGMRSYGIEANPFAAFATTVKLDWDIDPKVLHGEAHKIAELTLKRLRFERIDDAVPFAGNVQKLSLRELPSSETKLLLADSISPLPLHKTLTLLEFIRAHASQRNYQHHALALCSALVGTISNLHFGPEVGVGKPKKDVAVVAAWLRQVDNMCDDLQNRQGLPSAPANILAGDARIVDELLPAASVDAVITSPPYPNEKDYTRITRLESVILGHVTSRKELQWLKRDLIRSNTRNVYKGDADDQWIIQHPEIQRIADAIEERRIALGKTSGFERLYGRVTKLYFGGMARHLAGLRKSLRPNAQLAYVVGDQASYLRVMINTGQLLAEIARALGYQVVVLDLFRTRLATATRQQLREEVVVLRWPG